MEQVQADELLSRGNGSEVLIDTRVELKPCSRSTRLALPNHRHQRRAGRNEREGAFPEREAGDELMGLADMTLIDLPRREPRHRPAPIVISLAARSSPVSYLSEVSEAHVPR